MRAGLRAALLGQWGWPSLPRSPGRHSGDVVPSLSLYDFGKQAPVGRGPLPLSLSPPTGFQLWTVVPLLTFWVHMDESAALPPCGCFWPKRHIFKVYLLKNKTSDLL